MPSLKSALGVLALTSAILWTAERVHGQGNKPLNQLQKIDNIFKSIQWQKGPTKVTMRNIGQLEVPEGYKYTGEAGTRSMMEVTSNLPGPKDVGLLCPSTYSLDPDCRDWFIVFEWDESGYVKDDEKAQLDADAIMQSLKSGEEQSNQERARLGYPSLNLVGWEQAPFYDPQTNNLNWATRVRDNRGAVTINYKSRILGRAGVMSVELIIAPDQLQQELPKFKQILKAYSFQSGQKYSEWREGDRVATYGLTALIAGGAAAAAAKSGLLGKLGKGIIWIVVAVVGGISALFKKIFGSKDPGTAG